MGELVCIATHADAELGIGKTESSDRNVSWRDGEKHHGIFESIRIGHYRHGRTPAHLKTEDPVVSPCLGLAGEGW